MSSGTDKERLLLEFQEKKGSIAGLLLDATKSHPPVKKNTIEILNGLKELFPELETLKNLWASHQQTHPEEISLFWWNILPILNLNRKIEQEIKKKPFNYTRAREVFAYVLWLSFELLFKEDFRKLSKSESPFDEYEHTRRKLRSERIIFSILLINEKFKKETGFDDVRVFRQDVPLFFAKLPTHCEGVGDFSARIQSLGSIFEVDVRSLRDIITDAHPAWSSIRIIQKWLENRKTPSYEIVIKVWENIRLLRNAPPTHHKFNRKQLDALAFFGQGLPINFTKLWDSILDKFLESLERFQEMI